MTDREFTETEIMKALECCSTSGKSCKECVHYEVCEDAFLKRRIEVGEFRLCDCDNFIPKSRFVEFPCEVGQEWYWINFVSEEIETDRVIAITIFEDGFTIKTRTISSKAICTFSEKRFKQIMFSSKEEAEKALKERSK